MKKSKILMKLTALIVICILWLSFSYSQDILEQYFDSISDCGYWEVDSISTTNWVTEDTINYCDTCNDKWTYSKWKVINSNVVYLVYCPCGCGYPTEKYQYRINERGIRQKRYEITTYKYIPKPKTDYEQKLESIRKR
jgi:hypothetical protein